MRGCVYLLVSACMCMSVSTCACMCVCMSCTSHPPLHFQPKPEAELLELLGANNDIAFALNHLDEFAGPQAVKKDMMFLGDSAYIQHQPFGVVTIISPWNFPFLLVMSPLIGAIAAGDGHLKPIFERKKSGTAGFEPVTKAPRQNQSRGGGGELLARTKVEGGGELLARTKVGGGNVQIWLSGSSIFSKVSLRLTESAFLLLFNSIFINGQQNRKTKRGSLRCLWAVPSRLTLLCSTLRESC